MSDIYEIIQQKANGHEDTVPPDAWENIRKKKNKKRFGFFWWTAGILLFAGLLAGYYNYDWLSMPAENAPAGKIAAKETTDSKIRPNFVQSKPADLEATQNEQTKKSESIDTDEDNLPAEKSIPEDVLKRKQVQKESNIAVASDKRIIGTASADAQRSVVNNSPDSKDLLIAKKKFVRKNTSRFKMTIEPAKTESSAYETPGTNELASSTEQPKNIDPAILTQIGVERDSAMLQEKKTATGEDIAATETTPDTLNNKAKETVLAPIKKELTLKNLKGKGSWLVEFAVAPVFAIQQYDHSISFNRTLFLNADKSAFSGSLSSSRMTPSVAFSLGIKKALNQKSSVKIGVQYLHLNEKIRVSGIQTYTQMNINNGSLNYNDGGLQLNDTTSLIMESKRDFSAINRYTFLSVPVSFQYNFLQRKTWSLGVETGVNVNILSKYKNHINRNPEAPLVNISESTADKTNVSFALFGGLRIAKTINQRIDIFASPTFSYVPGQQDIKNRLINKKIHQAAVSFGVSYKLR